jgi:hypothetical protein
MVIHQLNAATNYLEVGRWCESHGFDASHRFKDRYELFDLVRKEVEDKEVAYLEFGVWKGETTRYWSKSLKNPNSVLHGFDSFEGLPERWNLSSGEGAFSVDGQIPQIDDPRVKFFKGWFNETLATYQVPQREVLVVNLDADIYSSTKTVLDALEKDIKPGSFLYFDEFCDRAHELRAFDEYLERTNAKFRLVAATETLLHVVFQRIG